MIRTLRRIGRSILYGGDRRLREYERVALEGAARALSEADRAALLRQGAAAERVQRGPGDRLVVFGYAPDVELPLLECTDDAHVLASVRVHGSGRSVWATVESHKGRLHSIGFRGAPSRLGAGPFVAGEVSSKRVGGDVAGALDRLEHGREGGSKP